MNCSNADWCAWFGKRNSREEQQVAAVTRETISTGEQNPTRWMQMDDARGNCRDCGSSAQNLWSITLLRLVRPRFRTNAPAPMVAGLRSIRIEIPRTGNSFLFTKILNVRDEPLSVQAKMMSLQTFQTMQMTGQVAAFSIVGWWFGFGNGASASRNSFVLTLALALIIASVCSLLIAWRALHDLLIVGFPCVVLGGISYLVWKYWPRNKSTEIIPPLMRPEGGIPPAVASFLLVGFFAFANVASADEPAKKFNQRFVPAGRNISILSANYSGTVSDRVAQLEATLQLSSSKSGETISLFGEDVAVQQFSVKSGDAKLVREGKNSPCDWASAAMRQFKSSCS